MRSIQCAKNWKISCKGEARLLYRVRSVWYIARVGAAGEREGVAAAWGREDWPSKDCGAAGLGIDAAAAGKAEEAARKVVLRLTGD